MHLVDELAENSLEGSLIQVNNFQKDYFVYRVFKLDLSETKHLLGHQKCTFKS